MLGFALYLTLLAQNTDEAIRIGPGVTPPKVIRRVEPEFSQDARDAGIQGMVLLSIAVDQKGKPTDISVVSPLGFGLDERAQAAIAKWEFVPAKKDGRPVKVSAFIEVSFRLLDTSFDEKAERRRTKFNVALNDLSKGDEAKTAKAVTVIQELSKEKLPAAMYASGLWMVEGRYGPKDPVAGWELMQKAADKNYGPALYQVGLRQVESSELQKGLETMRQASLLGSRAAQFYLGNRYEKGIDVPLELDRARRYFRLCAAQGEAACQYRLAYLMLSVQDRPERDFIQAVAWLQLATEGGLKEAQPASARETAKLTPEQEKWVNSVKGQLLRKP